MLPPDSSRPGKARDCGDPPPPGRIAEARWRGEDYGEWLADRVVRVEALAVLLRAAAVSSVGQVPVPVAVGGVAGLAESRVVVEASGVYLLEAVRAPERIDNELRAVGADRIAG